jgi:hypothetical protein
VRYRLGDIRLLPPVVVPKPKAAAPDKVVVERPAVQQPSPTPLIIKREVLPPVEKPKAKPEEEPS